MRCLVSRGEERESSADVIKAPKLCATRLVLAYGMYSGRVSHNLKGIAYRTHPSIPNHRGDGLVMTGDRDNIAFLGGPDHGGNGIMAFCNANGRCHDKTGSFIPCEGNLHVSTGHQAGSQTGERSWRSNWWWRLDSNQRCRKTGDLQSPERPLLNSTAHCAKAETFTSARCRQGSFWMGSPTLGPQHLTHPRRVYGNAVSCASRGRFG